MTLPYYKRYPRDFFEGTIGMTFEEKGAYGLILDLIYKTDNQLTDDARYIAGMLGCSVRKWNALKEILIAKGKLHAENGIISNLRATDLIEERRKYRDKKAENRSNPNKNKGEEKRACDSARVKPESEPETNSNELVGASAPSTEPPKQKSQPRGSARGKRIPPNWSPCPAGYAFASNAGFSPEEINHEAAEFRDYWIGVSGRGGVKLDWLATWRNHIRRQAKFRDSRSKGYSKSNGAGVGQKFDAFNEVFGIVEGDAAGNADQRDYSSEVPGSDVIDLERVSANGFAPAGRGDCEADARPRSQAR